MTAMLSARLRTRFTDTFGFFFGTDRIRQDVDMGTVRVNYHFGGPVVAKY